MRYIYLFIAAIIIIMILLPFTSRMPNYDDYIYLRMADEMQQHGMSTFSRHYDFLGYDVTFLNGTHTAAIGFFYMAIQAIAQKDPVWMHIIMHILYALTVIPLYMLFRHFRQSHIVPKILLTLTLPVLIVNANSFMSDIPAFIMFIWGLSLYVSSRGIGRYAGIALLVIGALFSYIFAFFPIILYLIDRNEGRSMKYVFISVFGLVSVLIALILLKLAPSPFTAMQWMGSRSMFNFHNVGNRFISYIMIMGLLSMFMLGMYSTFKEPMFYVSVFLGIVFGFTLPGYSFLSSVIASILIGVGIISLYTLFLREYRYRPLFLWFSLFSIAAIILFPMMVSRYILIIIVPMIIILLSEIPKKQLIFGIVLNICLSMLLLRSDALFAERIYSSVKMENENAYFTGEWAFRELMESSGARMLMRGDTSINQHSSVLLPQGMASWPPALSLQKHLILKKEHKIMLPAISVYSIIGRCGFYTDENGPLPLNIVFHDTLYISEFIYDTLSRPLINDSIKLWRNGPVMPVTVPCSIDLPVSRGMELTIRFFPSRAVFKHSDGIIVSISGNDGNTLIDSVTPVLQHIMNIGSFAGGQMHIEPIGDNDYNWIGIYAREKY